MFLKCLFVFIIFHVDSVHKGIPLLFMTISSSMLVSTTLKQENTGFASSLATSVCVHLLMLLLEITEKIQMFTYAYNNH